MRSQLLPRRTRPLIKTQPTYHRALLSSTHALRYPRKDHPGPAQARAIPRLSKRASSSVSPSPVDPDSPPPPSVPKPDDPPAEDPDEKPKRRTKASTKDTDSSPQLPTGLDHSILWTPEEGLPGPASPATPNNALPPPEIFQEILHNLYITLHPQTQHRAAYVSSTAPLVEPTFALYCPIEGGDYYIDETVRELARQTGAEVVVLDAVQLAAGECGHFGKAASALQLPNNPLHFASSPVQSARNQPRAMPVYDEDDDDPMPYMTPSRMTLQVWTPVPARPGRAIMGSTSRGTSTTKLKAFFDELINISAEPTVSQESTEAPSVSPPRRPRIIYVRDFSTLAPSSSVWYPALLAAVRQRRQGPISRPTSPVVNPITIVFGITPSIIAPMSASSSSPGQQGLMNMLMSRHAQSSTGTTSKQPKTEYGEDVAGDKGREKRMLTRLKRWARGDASSQDLPQLAMGDDVDDPSGGKGKPEVVLLGGPDGMTGLPSMLGSALSAAVSGRNRSGPSDSESRTRFFRISLVVPNLRSPAAERHTRMARRREINELTMRMGVAAIGGALEPMEQAPNTSSPDASENVQEGTVPVAERMREEWGKTVEPWSTVRRIADRAVGSVIAANNAITPTSSSLDPTPIPWFAIHHAWAADKSAQDLWKSMLLEPPGRVPREHEEDDEGKSQEGDEAGVDEVVERVKRDPELDQHEQRLLGCIVDATSLSTSFSQVHLSPHTIDSVRTIVSLPLLHPAAFQHGILKEHSMTGCLLFGPPGTGKTLVVRALAKEAGCRMLAISPSDVMDMYVGEGEKLVRSVFSLARRLSPCVVFIDEIDALFGARVSRETGGGIAHRGVITEFMQEMDGLKSSKEDNVIVIGATNRPFDLDDAVLRRLPRRLLVDLPGEKEREEILKILLRDESLSSDVDLKALAKKTESFSGSDLKHLCVSAALDAVKERVDVPWRLSAPSHSPLSSSSSPLASDTVSTSLENSADVSPSHVEPTADVASSTEQTSRTEDTAQNPATSEIVPSYARTISLRNFDKALKEITPSASESLGSLADLRKWNDEFGEGRRERKKQVWGKGRFGFTIEAPKDETDGRVAPPTTSSTDHDVTTVGDITQRD